LAPVAPDIRTSMVVSPAIAAFTVIVIGVLALI
jgi:hypothetical protein